MGLEADAEGFSDIAFAGQQPQAAGAMTRPGDEKLLVRFYTKTRPDEAATKEAGRPKFTEIEYVSIMVPGNKSSMVDRPATRLERERFPQHYQAFKQRTEGEEKLEGMPLSEWPGIVRSQVEELAFMNIRTVEQLSGISDTNVQGMMGLPMLRERAIQYLADTKDSAATEKLAHKLRERDERISGLEATITEMSAAIADLRKQAGTSVPVSQSDSEPSSRRGRPDSGQ